MAVIPDANALAETAAQASKHGIPPVDKWDPPFTADMDMVIAADGRWFHEGTPINRHKLVRLFSTILKREGDDYFLVTPVEKLGITVEDVPFLAVDFTHEDGALTFVTNVGDTVTADADHPIRVERGADEAPAPYVLVRRNLEARIDRKSFYRLVEIGERREVDGTEMFGVVSRGAFFPMIPAAELD